MIICLSTVGISQASYLVGGTISLTKVVSTEAMFKVNLALIIDVESTLPATISRLQSNNFIIVRIFRKRNNLLVTELMLPFINSKDVSYTDYDMCSKLRRANFRVYNYSLQTILLPTTYNENEGYYISWERCCRNDDINNIQLPESASLLLYMEFPSLQKYPQYSSPVFDLSSNEFVCKDKNFSFAMVAKDDDGDQLRYKIVTPINGYNTPNTFDNLVRQAPYPLISWKNGFSANTSIQGRQPLKIDELSGLLTLNTHQDGLYLFSVECSELRNGTKIGAVRCDFQFPIVNCSKNSPPMPIISSGGKVLSEYEYCKNASIVLQTQSQIGCSFKWQKDGIDIPGATQNSLFANKDGKYTVIKSLNSACSNDTISEPVTLREAETLVPRIISSKNKLCIGDTILLETQSLPNYSFQWFFADTPLKMGSIAKVTKPGWYYLQGKDGSNTCLTVRDSIKIDLIKDFVLNVSPQQLVINKGEQVQLKAISIEPNLSFKWMPPSYLNFTNIFNPISSPEENIFYTVIATSELGCSVSKTIALIVNDLLPEDRIYVADVFTPNGDGINDVLEIFNIDKISELVVSIYNRDGKQVFVSEKGYRNKWDGKFNGNLVPIGAYVYKIETNKINNKILIGQVIVIY